ncbi:MAG: hypothetical protein PHY45_08955 [Rhodocyclaceae bacterium]|nr:hypothetical protein [Rhodocyclaceae bacterium]
MTAEDNGLIGDPSFPLAVRFLEQCADYAPAAQLCPDLGGPLPAAAPTVALGNVILLHGGLSNGLADFADSLIGGRQSLLADAPRQRFQVYRYEHDTWLPIERNVEEIVALIERRIRGAHLLFIAFSRGGVVATHAAAQLGKRGRVVPDADATAIANGAVRDIHVMTFGSPHTGFGTSDVVSRLPRLGYCLQYLVSKSLAGLPAPLRRAIFMQSLHRLRRLPPGIAELSPANRAFVEFIRSREGQWIARRLQAFGGVPTAPQWWPQALRALLAHPVPGIGDGAVSLASATAYGAMRREIAGCAHNGYFRNAEVRGAIAAQLRRLGAMMTFT